MILAPSIVRVDVTLQQPFATACRGPRCDRMADAFVVCYASFNVKISFMVTTITQTLVHRYISKKTAVYRVVFPLFFPGDSRRGSCVVLCLVPCLPVPCIVSQSEST